MAEYALCPFLSLSLYALSLCMSLYHLVCIFVSIWWVQASGAEGQGGASASASAKFYSTENASRFCRITRWPNGLVEILWQWDKHRRITHITHVSNMRKKKNYNNTYSRTSLSRTRLFRITAYFEVKIWSLYNMKLWQQVTK